MGHESYPGYDIEEARRESVARNAEEKAAKRAAFQKRQKVRRKVYRIEGMIAGVVLAGTLFFVGNNLVNANQASNPSVTAGYNAVMEETHRTDDNQNFWFDYGDIADGFDPETMDFDSYVYGNYRRIVYSGTGRTITNMNDLFGTLHRYGYTEYSSFEDYCFAHGFTKEKDGKLVIDTDKYESEAREYVASLDDVQEFHSVSK